MYHKREVSENTRDLVFDRDWWLCIICWSKAHHCHHAWFWADKLEINLDYLNNLENLVALCYKCHKKIHDYWDKSIEEACKRYLIYKYSWTQLKKP